MAGDRGWNGCALHVAASLALRVPQWGALQSVFLWLDPLELDTTSVSSSVRCLSTCLVVSCDTLNVPV